MSRGDRTKCFLDFLKEYNEEPKPKHVCENKNCLHLELKKKKLPEESTDGERIFNKFVKRKRMN